LTALDYPGNIRQLENICQWLTVMSSGKYIDIKDLPPDILNSLEVQPSTQSSPKDGSPIGSNIYFSDSPPNPIACDPVWTETLKKEAMTRLNRNEPAVMLTLGREFERTMLECALAFSRGRKVEAAQRLGIGRNTLTRKCQELGIID